MKRLVVALVTIMLLQPALTTRARALTAPDQCAGAVRVGEDIAPTGSLSNGVVAAIFVHGITSSADMWLKPARLQSKGQLPAGEMSIVRAVAKIPSIVPYTFDYHAASLRWVTDAAIGPALAEAITCLKRATSHNVVVVGHSMGGLATLEAARHHGAANAIGTVVTIGTPYRGSLLLRVAKAVINGATIAPQFAAEAILIRQIIAVCGRAAGIDVDECGWLNRLLLEVPDSPAGIALAGSSDDLTKLGTTWPAGIAALQIAGDIIHDDGIWGLPRKTVHDGDVAGTVSSATGGSGKNYVVECQPGLFYAFLKSPCYHGRLPSNPDVVATTASFIRSHLDETAPPLTGQLRRVNGFGIDVPLAGTNDMQAVTLLMQPPGSVVDHFDVASNATILLLTAPNSRSWHKASLRDLQDYFQPTSSTTRGHEQGLFYLTVSGFFKVTRVVEAPPGTTPPPCFSCTPSASKDGKWLNGTLTISPQALGAVRVGMTLEQAQVASGGLPFDGEGEGFAYPTTAMPASFPHDFVGLGPNNTVVCVGAALNPNTFPIHQTVVTPEGLELGGTEQQLKAIYGNRARYAPAPAVGMTTNAGYVVNESGGRLAFAVYAGIVHEISGGDSHLDPNTCTG